MKSSGDLDSLTLKMEKLNSFKMSVTIYQSNMVEYPRRPESPVSTTKVT
jgi:hypothetical protein